MKAIMISIQPQWVEKILNGEKTIEIRKTIPKCELPVKVYIYCTMPNKQENRKPHSWEVVWLTTVVAEFTLNEVEKFEVFENGSVQNWNAYDLEKSCLTYDQIANYVGHCKAGYAWHIDDLKIYETPKELSEFSHYIPNNKCPKMECGIDCEDCMSYDVEHETCLDLYYLHRQIKRPPQSYCYVEELVNV